MALASLGSCIASTAKAANQNLPGTLTAQINTGEAVLVVIALDNVDTADGETSLVSSVRMVTQIALTTPIQQLSKVAEFTNGQGAAGAGVTVSIWKLDEASQNYTVATHALAGTLAASTTAKGVTAWRYSKTAGTTLAVEAYTTRADDGADIGALSLASLPSRQYLLLCGWGIEDNGVGTGSVTGYTAFPHATTSGGGAATNVGARGHFRIATVTSESIDPVSSATADHATILAAIYELASGTTYTKAGQINPKAVTLGFSATSKEIASAGAISPKALQSGADVFESSETGAVSPKAFESGSRNVVLSKAGQVSPKALESGADVAEYGRQAALSPKALVSGGDSFEASESGALLSKALQSGADSFQTAETGQLSPKAFESGDGVTEFNETGQLSPKAFMAGMGFMGAFPKTGVIAPKAQLSGGDVAQFSRAGTLQSKAASSGADAVDFTETGQVSPKASVSGVDNQERAKTGQVSLKSFTSGADAAAFSRTGSLLPKVSLSGSSSTTGGSTFTKSGVLAPRVLLSGTDTASYSRIGQLSPKAQGSGQRSAERIESGSVIAVVSLTGAGDQFFAKAGQLSAKIQTSAPREVVWDRAGWVGTLSRLAGISSLGQSKGGTIAVVVKLNPPGKELSLSVFDRPGALLWVDDDAHTLKMTHEVDDLETLTIFHEEAP